MAAKQLRIIFMGTPHFALPTLQKLVENNYNVIAVYTKPPSSMGRGNLETRSAIHEYAIQNGLNIKHPVNFKAEEDYFEFKNLNADIAIVAAYGIILPERILNSTKFGCINIHPSELPRWRGAAPIQHTILSNDTSTAVCVIQMDKGMDTGDILLKEELIIEPDYTALKLHDITSVIGANMISKVLDLVVNNNLEPIKQSEDGVTHARKIERSDEKIEFNRSASLINAQIRTFSPRPGAYFRFNDQNIKIISATYDEDIFHNQSPGRVLDDKLSIACGKGILYPKLLQREGKKMIYTVAFLRGFSIPKGSILS